MLDVTASMKSNHRQADHPMLPPLLTAAARHGACTVGLACIEEVNAALLEQAAAAAKSMQDQAVLLFLVMKTFRLASNSR
jgi:hypothetical protein